MFGIKIGDSSFPAENGQYPTRQYSLSYAIYRHLCFGFHFESNRPSFRKKHLESFETPNEISLSCLYTTSKDEVMNYNEQLKALPRKIGIIWFVGVFLWVMEASIGVGPFYRGVGADLFISFLSIVTVVGLYSWLVKKNSIWLILERTGIPMGILFSVLFLTTQLLDPIEAHLTYTFGILITGCFISAVGYVCKQESIPTEYSPTSFGKDLAFASLVVTILAFTMERAGGVNIFLDATSLIITLSPVTLLMLTNNKKASSRRYMQSIVVGVTGALFVCVMAWTVATQEENAQSVGPVIAISLLSMTYGVMILLVAASLSSDALAQKVDFGKINWHLLEVFALIILMIFAPESVYEFGDRLGVERNYKTP